MTNAPEVFTETLAAIDGGLVVVNMFCKPSAKFEGVKPFISFFQGCMVYKIGADRVQEVLAENSECVPYDPSGKGKPFKDWVQVPEGVGLDWRELGREAIGFQGRVK